MKTKNIKKIYLSLFLLLPTIILFFFVIFSAPSSSYALTIEPLWKVLGNNSNIKIVWTEVKNLVNIAVIAALIFVAFANILRIQINNYAVKKILPALILAVILTNFSYFICRFLVDIANVTLSLLIDGAAKTNISSSLTTNVKNAPGVAGAFDFSSKTGYTITLDNLWQSFFYIIAEIVGAIFIFILSFLFFIRNYVIYFLVGLSPLAFMATVLPQTKSAFNQWWSQFLRWTFMPIVSVFWLWLGGMWYTSGFNPSGSGASGITSSGVVPGADFNSDLFALAFAGLCYYLAITTPFKMGGQIMNTWAKAGKWAGNKAWGLTGKPAMAGIAGAGKMWWAGQAASQNKLNMLGHIARIPYNWKDRKEYLEKELEDRRKKANASVRLSRTGRRRYERDLGRGGDMEEAAATAERDYLRTARGQAWSEGRKAYNARMEILKNQIGVSHGQTDIDFIAGEGNWGKRGTKKYDTRQALLKSQIELHDISESMLSKKASDEENRSRSYMYDMLKRNEDLKIFQRIKETEKKLANAKTQEEREGLEKDLNGMKSRAMANYGLDEAQLKDRVENVEEAIKVRIQEITGKLDTDRKTGKLIIPYELSFGLKLSKDGKSIEDINGFKEGTGDPSGSRMKKVYGRLVAQEAQSFLEKFNTPEIIRQLDQGGTDFTADSAEAVMSNHPELAKNPLEAMMVQAAIAGVQKTLRTIRPDNPDYISTMEALPTMFKLMGPRGEAMSDQIQEDMIGRLISSQPHLFGRIQDNARRREVAEKLLHDADLFKGDIPGPNGEPETTADYYARLSSTRSHIPPVSLEGIAEFVKLDAQGKPIMKADGQTPEYEQLTSSALSGAARSVARSTLANDPIVGWQVPASEAVGFKKGDFNFSDVSKKFDSAIQELDQALISRTTSVENLARMVRERGRNLGVSDEAMVDRAFGQISDAHKKIVTSFAHQIGLTEEKMREEFTASDRIMLLEIMRNARNKTKSQLQSEIRSVFGSKLKQGLDAEKEIQVHDNYRF